MGSDHRDTRSSQRRCCVIVVSVVWLAVASTGGARDPEARRDSAAPCRIELAPSERAFAAQQLAEGRTRLRLSLVARPGRVSEAGKRVRALGGELLNQELDIDFLRVRVDISDIPELLCASSIEAAQLDVDAATGRLLLADAATSQQIRETWLPDADEHRTRLGAADSLGAAPHTGEAATGSYQLKREHPTYDGRGVVLGLIEPADPRTPSLASAKLLEGAVVPKVVDYIMLRPPLEDIGSAIPQEVEVADSGWYGAWRKTLTVRPDPHGRWWFDGRSFVQSRELSARELRMAQYRLRMSGSVLSLSILWAVDTGDLWFLEGDETHFESSNHLSLHADREHRPAIGRLRDQNVTVMLAVDRATRSVGLQLGSAVHGTMVASVAIGEPILGGHGGGVAPGAELVIANHTYRQSQNDAHLSWLSLFRHPRVDIISNSTGRHHGRKWLVDHRLVDWQFLEHAAARYPDKIFVSSAGNDGPVGNIDDGQRSGDNVITAGAYVPNEMWRANFGVLPAEQFTPAPFSNFGPSSDGGLKPDLLGLTGTLTASGLSRGSGAFRATRQGPHLELPEGYMLSGGTSAAAPNLAGHVALVVSAARQRGLPSDPASIKMALYGSASFLEGVEARIQGRGVVQVARALAALERLKDYAHSTFAVEAPIKTFYSPQLAIPNVGRGLYERAGWGPGQTGEREITIIRTTGPAKPLEYELGWKGDTAAFISPQTRIVLPLRQPVKLRIRVSIAEARAYSAILELIDPRVALPAHAVMCTIIAAEQLTAANKYGTRIMGVAPRPGHGFAFVNVPPGTSALRVRMTQRGGRFVSLNAQMPDGQTPKADRVSHDHADSNGVVNWRLTPSARSTYDHTFVAPLPGVWQFWITHDDGWFPRVRDAADLENPTRTEFTMEVQALGFTPAVEEITPSASRATIAFTSRFGPLPNARAVVAGVGGAREDSPVLPLGLAPRFYELTVAPGTSAIEAEVDGGETPGAHVSLLLFGMTGGEATHMGYDIGPGTRKRVFVHHPPPGTYKICLDAWGHVPAEGLKVRYRDTVYHADFGSATTTQATASQLSAGDTRHARVSWTDSRHASILNRKLAIRVGLIADGFVAMPPELDPSWHRASPASPVSTAEPVLLTDRTFVVSTRWTRLR